MRKYFCQAREAPRLRAESGFLRVGGEEGGHGAEHGVVRRLQGGGVGGRLAGGEGEGVVEGYDVGVLVGCVGDVFCCWVLLGLGGHGDVDWTVEKHGQAYLHTQRISRRRFSSTVAHC
jgi:hypothetical protein